MSLKDWVDLFLQHNRLKVIHIHHLEILTGMNRHALRMALGRLAAQRTIRRICRGYYANPFHLPTLEEISAEICKPSYISLESALHRHGILSQAPQVLTCITTGLPRTVRTSFGTILCRQIQKGHFFGFRQEQGYALANPEKALADFLYMNRRASIRGMASEFDLRPLHQRRLKSYAKRLRVTEMLRQVPGSS